VDIVQEWHVATQHSVNERTLCQMNGTNCDLVNAIPLRNYLQNTLTVCIVTTPVHDLSKNNLMEHPLLKNIVIVDEQSSAAYNTMQPTSHYITSVWFTHSIVSDDKQFRDVMNSFVQLFIQSNAGQLMIDILTWCHKILSTFHENYFLFLNFDLSV
jgi:hypothetical protein